MVHWSKMTKMHFGTYSVTRYLSMAGSFLITLLMIKEFEVEEFVTFQTALSCFVILYWVIDLGTIDLIILSKNDNSLITKYSSGRTIRYYLVTGSTCLILYFAWNPLLAMVVLAVSLDYFNDSMTAYRTVRTSLRYFALTLIIRKIIPLLYLVYTSTFKLDNIFSSFLFVTIISNLPWVIIDTLRLPFSWREIFYSDKNSKMNTLQQGGNFLLNLDVPLLNLLGFSSIIPPFVLGKRLLQAGSIFGQFQIPMILDSDFESEKIVNIRIRIAKNYIFTLIFSLVTCFICEIISRATNFLQFSLGDRALLYGCLVISSLGVVATQQNALLKALQRFDTLSYATFFSTFAYLFTIIILLPLVGVRWYFLIALLINFSVELAVQETALKSRVL